MILSYCSGIYPNKYKSAYKRDTHIPMFIAALFTIAKLWNWPSCPTTDEWIKKIWYTYHGILLSHKEKWN
jgi:hypothetical protein